MTFFSDGFFENKNITVIGAAILDVLAGPVTSNVFQTGSQPMDHVKLSFGGDALNETLALSRLGQNSSLISKVGNDEAGHRILDYLKMKDVSTDQIIVEDDLETGVNIVLIDENGERHFLTNPSSSLRKLQEKDILPFLDQAGEIVSFASIFVSPALDLSAMERIFRKVKNQPDRILVADMTKPKHGETLADIKVLLPYIDYLLPNKDEIAMLTGISDPVKNAELLLEAGVSHTVIKCGKDGCVLGTRAAGSDAFPDESETKCIDTLTRIPAFPTLSAIDSTGAGDCFAAGFLWALARGWNPVDCCRFACATASCSVESFGATDGIRSVDEIIKRFQSITPVGI